MLTTCRACDHVCAII